MANNKKNKPKSKATEKKMFRYWIWLFLIGPAIFFVLYWLSGGSNGTPADERTPLPEQYRQAGETYTFGENSILAAPGGRLAYVEKILIGYNNIAAEGGSIFSIIPVRVSKGLGPPNLPDWYIVDSDGAKYNLLKATENDPAGIGVFEGIPSENLAFYLIFKVNKNNKQEKYLVYSADRVYSAWKIPPP